MSGKTGSRRKQAEGGVRIIRASEIGEYAYCSRAWWYKHVVKLPPSGAVRDGRFEAGQKAHRRHGRTVATAIRLQMAGIALLVLGLIMLAIVLLLSTQG